MLDHSRISQDKRRLFARAQQAEEALEAHMEDLMDEMQKLKQQLTAANKR